ncbi:MAG: formate--tetrahydrofolate ligase [Clostridia bacterium]|nr:formate--tetrahydrofolate ligase [Clostridia bacterium]
MLSDIDIARKAKLKPITQIAARLGLEGEDVELYGHYKAKINPRAIDLTKTGKLVLVTAITPTPAGEGKTTTTIGLVDALNMIGKKAIAALREPSLGPVFGVKGGAAGGGYAQVVPMEDINLHFTGDFHAIAAANNLLAALIDNHIHQSNSLGIDPRRVVWKRCIDINDRQLRHIVAGLGGRVDGTPREDGFDITAASEVMATICLSSDIDDLKKRLSRLIVGFTKDGDPVTAGEINAAGAMAVLLKDAIRPNLVQTLEHSPAFIHGGPFANIAHGCNSLIATRCAMSLGEYAVTEAGFGADLGCEKFIDIKCRAGNIRPDAIVVVATVRALKYHGGVDKKLLAEEDVLAAVRGLDNLYRHVDNIKNAFGLDCVVALNRFPTDTQDEFDAVLGEMAKAGINAVVSNVHAEGGAGGVELAKAVVELCEKPGDFHFAYDLQGGIAQKIETIARKIYRAGSVSFSSSAKKQIRSFEKLGYGNLPVCVAKTQYSFTNDAAVRGAPEGFEISVASLRVSAGAGFIVAMTGTMSTMPGLSPIPAAENIDIDANGVVTGLF